MSNELDDNSELPITLTYKINFALSPEENIKNFLGKCSITAMEFFTQESLNIEISHLYENSTISIMGDPTTVDKALKDFTELFREYLKAYTDSEENFDDKIISLLSVKYLINEFLLKHQPYSNYLHDLPKTYLLHSIKDMNRIEVNLLQLPLTSYHYKQINQHLEIRSNHFKSLNGYVGLFIEKLKINNNKKLISSSLSNEEKELQLLEVWLSLKKIGFIDFVPNKVEESKIRKHFFTLFNLTDKNYKSRCGKILDRKLKEPKFLLKMVAAFKEILYK